MAIRRHTSPERAGFALGLPQHRGRKGLSLEQIAESTKISIRFLRAIEAEDFSTLPGGIFSTSYIRQYARAVEFDADRLLACYSDSIGEGDLDIAGRHGARQREQGRRTALEWFRAISPIKL
jgi:cytoskeletal protein RodZ